MDLRKIKKLIELLEESELIELEITEGENTIRLSRAGRMVSMEEKPVGHTMPPVSLPQEAPREDGQIQEVDKDSEETTPGTLIESPMVGTYYNSPSPEAEPFVTVGSLVQMGQTLCIVEAMKTFNQVDSEVSGVVRHIYKHNGDPVEYGEPLFLVE